MVMRSHDTLGARWWKCPRPGCAGAATAKHQPQVDLHADTPTPVPVALALPTSAMAPLFFACGSCSERAVLCECCSLALDAEREVDGVLLCKRCGFLTVLDVKLRTQVQIAPFSRAVLNRLAFAVQDRDRLRAQLSACEAKLRHATSEQPGLSRDVQGSVDAATNSGDASEPRQCCATANAAISKAPPPSDAQQAIQRLVMERRRLMKELHDVSEQWQLLMENSSHAPPFQCFSSTHMDILRVMYEKSIDKSELVEIMASIEQFLLQRSTIVKVKYDLLEALKIQLQLDDVSALPAGHAPRHDRGDYSTAIRVVRNCATEQFRHRYASFQALSKRYMALIGYANKHLFALYSAAQNLSKMQLTTLEAHADQTVDHVRKRRRFGAAVPTATQPRLPGTGRAVARVQQSIEYGNRLSEISKKVDLWRSLSYTIATSCVFDVIEIWNGDGES